MFLDNGAAPRGLGARRRCARAEVAASSSLRGWVFWLALGILVLALAGCGSRGRQSATLGAPTLSLASATVGSEEHETPVPALTQSATTPAVRVEIASRTPTAVLALVQASPANTPPRPQAQSTRAIEPSATTAPSQAAASTVTATSALPTAPPPPFTSTVRIAVIGDYGLAAPPEGSVANLVKGWHPDIIITTGDNNYPSGSAETIDRNVGQFYHEFIQPYLGKYGQGADRNRFFPTLGNHDWLDPGAKAYLDYFTLPGNERYYDLVWGPVHLFALDSISGEPDGTSATSKQALWLQAGLQKAAEPWKLVYLHYPPFSSGPHGPTEKLQWPYGEWGATAVFSGHDHIYERIARNGIVYFVNGLGGASRYEIGTPVPESQARYNADFGAMLIEADGRQITFQFINRGGKVIDSYAITR